MEQVNMAIEALKDPELRKQLEQEEKSFAREVKRTEESLRRSYSTSLKDRLVNNGKV
jgi:hypothetical protein